MRLLGWREKPPAVPVSTPVEHAIAEQKLGRVEARWQQERQQVDPVLAEVRRVERMMTEQEKLEARAQKRRDARAH